MIQQFHHALSHIDSARFGICVSKAVGVKASDVSNVLDFCSDNKVALLIARCDISEIETVHKFEQAGFLMMDTLIYYSCDLSSVNVSGRSNPIAFIESASRSDADLIRKFAYRVFSGYTGHYQVDPRLNMTDCNEIYPDWAYNYCLSKNDMKDVLLLRRGDDIFGFGALQKNSSEETEGVLYGVAPEVRGKGVYFDLLQRSIEWSKSKGALRMIYSTQLTNISAQRVLCRSGFVPIHGFYTFHKWFV